MPLWSSSSRAIPTLGAAGLLLVGAVSLPAQGTAPKPAGAIEGRITFEGQPPLPTFVVEGGSTQHVLHLGDSGGLQYAVVFLPDAAPDVQRRSAAPSKPVILNQRSFIFEPQVIAIRAGQRVRFTSEDSANHNVQSNDPNPANTFNVNMSPGGPPRDEWHVFAATSPDRPVVLGCEIHTWMIAWVYAFDHDQFALTDNAGRFRIDNVPPGRHRLSVRQPAGRLARDLAVEVVAGRTTRQDVRFASADLGIKGR